MVYPRDRQVYFWWRDIYPGTKNTLAAFTPLANCLLEFQSNSNLYTAVHHPLPAESTGTKKRRKRRKKSRSSGGAAAGQSGTAARQRKSSCGGVAAAAAATAAVHPPRMGLSAINVGTVMKSRLPHHLTRKESITSTSEVKLQL